MAKILTDNWHLYPPPPPPPPHQDPLKTEKLELARQTTAQDLEIHARVENTSENTRRTRESGNLNEEIRMACVCFFYPKEETLVRLGEKRKGLLHINAQTGTY